MVKLDDIIEGLEFMNDETGIDVYYNPDTMEIFYSNIEKLGDITEDELDELFDNSIMFPTKYEINEYLMMKNFIETINDTKIQNQLYIAIDGKGAFKRFKGTCINFEIIDNWYKFRDEKYKEIAIKWCRENNINFKE